MKSAVVASTLTTVAVFLPMVFVEGIAGQAFGDLSLAVVISLLASLAVAVYFVPMLASRRPPVPQEAGGRAAAVVFGVGELSGFVAGDSGEVALHGGAVACAALGRGDGFRAAGAVAMLLLMALNALVRRGLVPALAGLGRYLVVPVARVVGAGVERVTNFYPRLIQGVLDRPAVVLGGVVLIGWVTWEAGRRLETELLPEVHQGEFTFEVNLPVGTPIEQTQDILGRVEQAILADRASIRTLLVSFGYDVRNLKRSDEGEHSARFKVVLESGRDPVGTEERVLARLRRAFADVPDLELRVVRPVLFSAETPLLVEIEGDDLEVLKRLAREAEQVLARVPELADVETTLRRGAPEIQIVYDRDRLVVHELNLQTVARQVRDLVKGFEATRFNLKDRRVPVVVRLEERDRAQLEDVGRLVVNPGADQSIPLAAVATLGLGRDQARSGGSTGSGWP
ncbi:MAG: efflux RND transporter permease subunit [Verrucomicrobia bacterium]|nr:efflux RND transporter permease subunit [Verrucomicrobiota bacterium]